MQDPTFRNRLKCRWTYFRSTILSNNALNNYIDATASKLNEAQARHFEKWGNLGLNTGTPEIEQDPEYFCRSDFQIQKLDHDKNSMVRCQYAGKFNQLQSCCK
ncbi:CotH kinase family protein [Flavobacterium sp. 3HN19-14]|uniref:CotH kinase family protein n=1 Tax=Flavobacterium sp. 3HN19-14 TaxID=3448133 RepID=UPI003EDF94D1